MTTAAPNVPSTSTTQAVLSAFVEEFLVDVPAVHRDGEYLIRFDDIVSHVNNLDYEDLVQISIEAEVL